MTNYATEADAYAEIIAEHLDDLLLPEEPNATRIRITGTTRNKVGEFTDATETELPFRLDLAEVSRTDKRGATGEAELGFFRWQELEGVLEPGDLFEVGGVRYQATSANPRRMQGSTLIYSGNATRLEPDKRNPFPESSS